MSVFWLDDVRAYLVARGIGATSDWPLYEGYLPDDQDQMLAIFSTGGRAPETLGSEVYRVGMQLRVRAGKLAVTVAYQKWKDCFNVLQRARQGTFSASLLPGFQYIIAVQAEPLTFTDENGRTNLTSSWDILINSL